MPVDLQAIQSIGLRVSPVCVPSGDVEVVARLLWR
jgi:hypothetical protein